MRRTVLILGFVTLVTTAAYADDNPVFVVYGSNFMVSVDLPSQWNVDMSFAKSHGMNGFFYLKDYGIQRSPAGIMLLLVRKRSQTDKLSNYITWDQRNLLRSMPLLKIEPYVASLENSNKYVLRSFEYSQNNEPWQIDSYLDTRMTYFINFYITFRDPTSAGKYLPDYLNAVKKLRFLPVSVKEQ